MICKFLAVLRSPGRPRIFIFCSSVNIPFELLKKEINDTFSNITFDASILPVPDVDSVEFCDGLDTSYVDEIGSRLVDIGKIGTIILIGLALLLIGANCILVWYKWRCMRKNLENARRAWKSDPTVAHINLNSKSSPSTPQVNLTDHDLMILKTDTEHPLLTKLANFLATRTHMTPTQHTKMRWFFHYVFHPPALACFLIGFFGLLSVVIQLIVMRPMLSTSRALADSAVSDFSNTIANALNQSMYNQSSLYASQINSQVDVIQTTINGGLFGWVNTTTSTIETTIHTFYTELQNAISSVLGGTILGTLVQALVACLIGSKVNAIDDALTFLQNNLKVNMPVVDPSILILSPQSINEATAPIASAAIGGGASGKQGVLGHVVDVYEASLKKELLVFGAFMGLWVMVVLSAICILLWENMKSKKQR